MAKTTHSNYADELQDQIRSWNRKPGLRFVYEQWYAQIVASLSPLRPVVEIGSGCGNFKRFFPETVATDVIHTGEWIDQLVDARQLPFAENSVGNFVLIDCLHHLPRPLEFLRQAARALRPGGRIVMLEPAITLWSRLVWKFCHHEPVVLTQDFFAEDGLPEPENPGFAYANMGTAHLLFTRNRDKLLQAVPGVKLQKLTLSDALIYPLTGGFSYWSLLPADMIKRLYPLERACVSRIARLTALRMLIVLERDSDTRPG